MRNKLVSKITLAVLALAAAGMAAASTTDPATTDAAISAKVGHEIRMYSWYSIWDNIEYRVNDGNVQLLGEVSQPFKKIDIGRIVQRIPGVTSVTNDLKVLPLSPYDDQLRMQVARAIFRDPELSQYAMQPVPPIHIIVDNGHVTLDGVVATQMDKNIAGLRASGVMSLGQVTNNLRVEQKAGKKG